MYTVWFGDMCRVAFEKGISDGSMVQFFIFFNSLVLPLIYTLGPVCRRFSLQNPCQIFRCGGLHEMKSYIPVYPCDSLAMTLSFWVWWKKQNCEKVSTKWTPPKKEQPSYKAEGNSESALTSRRSQSTHPKINLLRASGTFGLPAKKSQ
jgi:hypothetical protein